MMRKSPAVQRLARRDVLKTIPSDANCSVN
jgi:hypothetical protein